ncbi:MAG TPA: polyprenyl synthetase family protein [Anaerolineae bacterium]|nr:polyprenyl synthetase family protein [Anaerolineae bacterium]
MGSEANMQPQDILARYAPAVEAEMQAVLATPHPSLAPFYNMMGYHLGWLDQRFQPTEARTGKRVRPALCLLACEALGGDPETALPAAAAIELVHNFSLIHDDIEDGSATRRGRPTVWSVWGEPHAINVGDGMLILARLALHRLAERGVEAARIQAIARVLDEACLALCQGQYLDLSFEERLDVTIEEYLAMVEGKTAALLSAATRIGAMLADDDKELILRYRRFGRHLGIAFQIVDDILGLWGDEAVTGKSAVDDILSKKKTLPIVYALEQERGEELRAMYRREALSKEDVRAVLAILDEVGARGYAQRLAEGHRQRALAELERTGIKNEAQDRLRQLALFLTQRTY